jgi:hypothetical protein
MEKTQSTGPEPQFINTSSVVKRGSNPSEVLNKTKLKRDKHIYKKIARDH